MRRKGAVTSRHCHAHSPPLLFYRWASSAGVVTCVGTEIPLTIPPTVPANASLQDVYEGIFARLKVRPPPPLLSKAQMDCEA